MPIYTPAPRIHNLPDSHSTKSSTNPSPPNKKPTPSTKSKVIRRGATLVNPLDASTKSFRSQWKEEEEQEEGGEPMQTALWKRLSQDLGARQTRAQTLDEPADSPVYDRNTRLLSLDPCLSITRNRA